MCFVAIIRQIFSIHTVHNPDIPSELELLRSYAPDISAPLAGKLAAVFQELRRLEQHGELACVLYTPCQARNRGAAGDFRRQPDVPVSFLFFVRVGTLTLRESWWQLFGTCKHFHQTVLLARWKTSSRSTRMHHTFADKFPTCAYRTASRSLQIHWRP